MSEKAIIGQAFTTVKESINQFQLVDMAILIGNDYFSGIKNIGPKHAHKFLIKHKNLEKVIVEEKNK